MPPLEYNFGLRDRAGIIAGLTGPGAIVAGIGCAIALALLMAGTGLLLPGIILGACAILAFAPVGGRPAQEWVRIFLAYAKRLIIAPPQPPALVSLYANPSEEEQAKTADIQVVEAGRWGFLVDGHQYIALLRLSGGEDFVLASDTEQDQSVAEWGSFLASLAREGSPIQRLQIIERATPAVTNPAVEGLATSAVSNPDALRSYQALLAHLGQSAMQHETYLALAILPRVTRDIIRSVTGEAEAVLQTLEQHQVTVQCCTAQDIRSLQEHIRFPQAESVDAIASLSGRLLPALDNQRTREDIDTLLIGNTRHRVWEITEWPRVNVTADWLHPLLAAQIAGQRIVSIHIKPVPTWKATRKAEHASTNAASEMRRKGALGFESRARDVKALEAVSSREDELAGGYTGVEISGAVMVSAVGREALEQASRDVTDAMARSRLQAHKLYGRQRAGLQAVLPLCRPLSDSTHATTTRHACTLYPLQIASAPSVPGVAVGWDVLSGGTYTYDPFKLYEAGVITSPNMLVMGRVGRGKSAFTKAYLWRQSQIFGRKVWIAGDPKGEYSALANACGLPIIRLTPGGTTRINPLDPGAVNETSTIARHRLELLQALAAAQLERALTPAERAVLTEAVKSLPRDAVLSDVVRLLFAPSEQMVSELHADVDELSSGARELALEINRLLTGDLAGMFDGHSTVSVEDSRGGVIDLSGVYGHKASLVPIMVCVTQWLTQQLLRHDEGKQTIIVLDEAWQALSATGVVDWAAATAKLSRAFGVQLMIILHRLSDLAAVGDDNQAITKKTQGLLQDAETVITFAQAEAEIPLARDLLGLSDREASLLPALGRGRCLALVGRYHTLVDVELTDTDTLICNTDQAI